MKIHAKRLFQEDIYPIKKLIPLRCSVYVDKSTDTIYVTPVGELGNRSCGISVKLKAGYSTKFPTDYNLSQGHVDGDEYWIAYVKRPLSFNYKFDIKKDGVIVKTYTVITFLIEEK